MDKSRPSGEIRAGVFVFLGNGQNLFNATRGIKTAGRPRARESSQDHPQAALAEIRDSRIYRNTFATFEEYCRERWGFTKTYANNIIAASEVVSNLTTLVVKPATETQARPLAKLPAEQQPAAW